MEYLFKWCLPDQAVLVRAGLDWVLVTDLPTRIDAAREAQSVWFGIRFTRKEAQQHWVEVSPAGYALRDDLIHTMRYAYRHDEGLLIRVDAVPEGAGDADMIQDLNDLCVIGRENLALLVAVGLDLASLDEAALKSKELGTLRADATVDKGADREAKTLRDRAYTHLKEAVDEIRACGQFVFWKDEARLKGYKSAYRRRARKAAPDTIPETTPDQTSPAS